MVRDSNLPALKIISEKESRKKDRIGFHGRFPLQKPRMLVRFDSYLFHLGDRVVADMDSVPISGAVFFYHNTLFR